MNENSVLDLNIDDVVITPEPFPDIEKEFADYAKNQRRGMSLQTLLRTGKIRIDQGKRPHRDDGTKYTQSPRTERTAKMRAKAKAQKASRRKNRGK